MNPYLTFCIACYAAFLSTLVFVWDITKWKASRARLRIELEHHSRPAYNVERGQPSETTWQTVTVTNIGAQTSTITRITFLNRLNWFQTKEETVLFRNHEDQLPQIVEPGKQWRGHPNPFDLDQFVNPKKRGLLLVYHSMSDRPAKLRLW
jgi:hypothetical protein